MHYYFLPLITLDVFYVHCQVWNKSCICRRVCCMKFTIYFSGGSSGAPLARSFLTSQNSLNFMQFFRKFGKLVCWRPLEGRRPSYGESWIPIDSLVFLLLFFFMFGSCFRLVCIRYPFLHRRKSNIHKMKLFTIFLWISELIPVKSALGPSSLRLVSYVDWMGVIQGALEFYIKYVLTGIALNFGL